MPLLLSSYKGVPFHISSAEDTGGRRLAEHEYPNAEDWYVEDLGIAINNYSVTAYISTDCDPEEAYAASEALRAVCRTPGSGPLVLPPATFVVAHCHSCRRTVTKDTQGYITFSLEFVEAGTGLGAPFQVGLAIRLVASAMAIAVATISDIGGMGLAIFGPAPEFLLASGIVVRNALAVFDDTVKVAVAIPEQTDVLEQAFTTALYSVTAFESSGKPFYLAPPNFPVVQPSLLPQPGAPPAPTLVQAAFSDMIQAVSTYMQMAADTTSQPAMFASLLQAAVMDIGSDPMPGAGMAYYPDHVADTNYSINRAGTVSTVGQAMRILSGIAMCEAFAGATYERRMDAQAARGLMVGTVDQIISSVDGFYLESHPGSDELMQARDAASSAILGIIANLKPMVQMSLNEAMPALYLAWRIYQDPNRAQELADRNDAPHPFFMPTTFEAQTS